MTVRLQVACQPISYLNDDPVTATPVPSFANLMRVRFRELAILIDARMSCLPICLSDTTSVTSNRVMSPRFSLPCPTVPNKLNATLHIAH